MHTIDQAAQLAWLEQQFEDNFHCMVGPPRAYFELAEPLDNPRHLFRVVYQTFLLAGMAASEEQKQDGDVHESLVKSMWNLYFKPVVDELQKRDPERTRTDNLVFWRKKPAFESVDEGNGGTVKLRLRLAIPGIRIPGEVQL